MSWSYKKPAGRWGPGGDPAKKQRDGGHEGIRCTPKIAYDRLAVNTALRHATANSPRAGITRLLLEFQRVLNSEGRALSARQLEVASQYCEQHGVFLPPPPSVEVVDFLGEMPKPLKPPAKKNLDDPSPMK